jgi:hypothetical protein
MIQHYLTSSCRALLYRSRSGLLIFSRVSVGLRAVRHQLALTLALWNYLPWPCSLVISPASACIPPPLRHVAGNRLALLDTEGSKGCMVRQGISCAIQAASLAPPRHSH